MTGRRFTFEPPDLGPEAAAIGEWLTETAMKSVRERITATEAACYVALERGCGVRVDDYQDGWAVGLDPTNTAIEVREYRHGHPQYPGGIQCVNCESLEALRRDGR